MKAINNPSKNTSDPAKLNSFKFKHASRGLVALAALALSLCAARAQVSITTLGSAVTQNFDGMGSSGTATLPTGFKIGTDWSTGTSATTLAYGSTGAGVVTGTSGGGVINWANGVTASATDRSLGFLNTGTFTSPRSIVFALQNNTGSTITSLTISYDYEQTRSGTRAFDWTFFHGSTSSPSTSATGGDQSYAVEANNTTIFNPPTTTSKSFTISGLSIAPGATYYLKWTLTGVGGSTNGKGIGIDNFSITATGPSLAAEPTTDASSLGFANVQSGQMDVSWTIGNGANRIVVAKSGSAPTGTPTDGTGYTANASYGTGGTALGDGFVVYNGVGNSFTLTGLAPSTTYHLKIFEFNGSSSTANYLTSGTPGSGSQMTAASANSTASDIIRASGFTEPANVAYATYQATDITDVNSIELARFTVRDGGVSADADSASTTLDAIGFTVANGAALRRVALYDGTTEVAEVAGGTSVSFSGLSGLVAADGGTKNFSVRATFIASVTDNQQLQLTVSSATANAGGSTFAAADAGGASSDTTSDANRIEVTASKLAFSSVSSSVNVSANFSATVQAQDANNNLDLDDTTSVTITLASGSGTLTGSGAQSLVSGTQTRVTLQMDTAGIFTIQAAGGSLANATSGNITAAFVVVQTANFSPVILPQVMPSGTSTRLPVVFRATVSGLAASTTYRYYTQAAISTDFGTIGSGAGVVLLISADGTTFTTVSTGSLTTPGGFETFTTDGSGQYTGWFGFVNTGNSRFTAGNTVFPSLVLGDSSGTLIARWAATTGIQVLTFSTSAGANNGTGIRGTSSAAAKDFVALYDNTAGTGSPLAVTYVESEGFSLSSLVSYYGTVGSGPVDGIAGAWGTIIPNSLASGVRRIARFNNAGSLVIAHTDADGVWPSTANTVNPTGGTTAIVISSTDARLNNQNPVATNDVAATTHGSTMTLAGFKLLANDSDLDGDTLTITAASATSGSASLLGGDVQYTAPASGSSDAITYTISDGYGGTANGTVNVTLTSANVGSLNVVNQTLSGNNPQITFAGVANVVYAVDHATSVSGPWSQVGTPFTFPTGVGVYVFTDVSTDGTSGSHFYRTRYVSGP